MNGSHASRGEGTGAAAIAGLSAKTVAGASAFSYPILFLPFISSAFVPSALFWQVNRWAMVYGARLRGVSGL